jgi:hypothetical protein
MGRRGKVVLAISRQAVSLQSRNTIPGEQEHLPQSEPACAYDMDRIRVARSNPQRAQSAITQVVTKNSIQSGGCIGLSLEFSFVRLREKSSTSKCESWAGRLAEQLTVEQVYVSPEGKLRACCGLRRIACSFPHGTSMALWGRAVHLVRQQSHAARRAHYRTLAGATSYDRSRGDRGRRGRR